MAPAPAQNLILADYEWILIVGSFAAFLFGFGTGSNDVANAFGTSVGAKTITLKTAVLLAIIFEFTGALVLGRVSQETISGGLSDIGAFTTEPEFYAYGMMWALIVGGVWQIIASAKELNVSATHSIIGAIVGFTMTFKGRNAVIWAQQQIVCSGPLTAVNTDGEATNMMFFTPVGSARGAQPLAASYSIPMDWVINTTDGSPISNGPIVNASMLSARIGMQVISGNSTVTVNGVTFNLQDGIPNATWAGAVNPCFAKSCYGQTSAGLTWSSRAGPFYVNDTRYPFGSVAFLLRTATTDSFPESLNILPQESLPIIPGQFFYKSTAGWCTTGSNAALPFPPFKGVLIIVLSWFFSPVLTGIASSILFLISRTLVLRHANAYKRAFFVIPPLAFLTLWVNVYFVLTKGAAKMLTRDAEGWTTVKAAWISAAAAGGVSFFSAVVVAPLVYMRIQAQEQEAIKKAEDDKAAAEAALSDPENGNGVAKGENLAPVADGEEKKGLKDYLMRARNAAMHGMEVDIHGVVEEDEIVAAIHANAEVFDAKAELVFSYMQVFSAICVIFAHGAGEVGYMSGPLGAILSIIRSGTLASSSSPPIWTILIGALGLVIGLGTYGYQVTRAIGTRMAKLTASRGFAAELSTAMIIMIAAQYGLPTSSSQCITGGVMGIALCEGKKGINAKLLFSTFMSWIWTVVFVALITGGLFAQGAYAPSAQMARQLGYYEQALSARTNYILKQYQGMIKASGYNTDDTNDQFAKYLAQTISNTAHGQYYSFAAAPAGYYPGNKAPVIQTVFPWQMVGYLDTALALASTAISPKSSGLNMCNGNSPTTNNYAINGANGTNFPWSQTVLTAGMFLLKNATNGPCTLALGSPSFKLTATTFVGPSPLAAMMPAFEDSKGNAIASYNGTIDWLMGATGNIPAYGMVTLDQVPNYFPCQQAPCNTLAPLGGFNVSLGYNGR